MAKQSKGIGGVFSPAGVLAGAAMILAVIAVLLWVVPLYSGDSIYVKGPVTQMFHGLTDFFTDARQCAECTGRMPAFMVTAFASIFLLVVAMLYKVGSKK